MLRHKLSIGICFISSGSGLMGVSFGKYGILTNSIASLTSGQFIAGVIFVTLGYYFEYKGFK